MKNGMNINEPLDFMDYALASLFCVVFTIVCILFSPRVFHWFIFPLIPCGILIGVDAIGWFRGKYDVFDPKGLMGLLGFHFFFVSQLMVIVWDMHTVATAIFLNDYRPWIGLLAIFNVFGLLIYRVVENAVFQKQYKKETAKVWVTNESRWFSVLMIFIVIAFIAQAYLVFKLGYVGRISYDISERWEVKGGVGVFRLLGGVGPILLMFFLTLARRKIAVKESSFFIVCMLLVFMAVVSLFFGGLVGSRGATVWSVFWIVGIIHFFWRRFAIKEVVIGFCILILFMNIYGFFKKLGTQGLDIFRTEGWTAAVYESGISIKGILVGDLSRSDVNAYMAYILVEKPYSYRYRYGETVWGDILVQFPIWIYPNYYNMVGASGKMRAGTDLMMGQGHFDAGNPFSKSRYVYGLTGQVMLNFGILPIPLAFVILGYFVGRFRRAFANWKPYDMRYLLVPIVLQLLIMLLTHDLENQINTIIFRASFPFVAIWLMSIKIPRCHVEQQLECPEELEYYEQSPL